MLTRYHVYDVQLSLSVKKEEGIRNEVLVT